MQHENSVFHSITRHIPWSQFARLVDKHQSDHRVRRLSSKGQFLALLFGQFSGAESLRDIEAGLASQRSHLYHLGGTTVARSTLADANANRSWVLYGEMFSAMAASASRSTHCKLGDAVRILDASTARLTSLSTNLARFQHGTDQCQAAPCL